MKMDAINAWQGVVGSKNVLTDETTISTTQTATFATTQRVLAVIRPINRAEVQECVRVANQYQIPLYPISCGKNWGLGSQVPVKSDCVILDLNRLNKIIDYDEKLAYITVEPGVTFQQVFEYLKKHKSNLFVSVTGGPSHASLIGNTLERGDGIGPYGERLEYVSGMEVVLPTGEYINTGYGHFANSKIVNINRWGIGPYIDGIFTQSNLGIVTKMTMWLMPIPKYLQIFTCCIIDTSHLQQIFDAVQTLVLQGIIRNNSFSIYNSYKVLATQGRYPWKKMLGQTPFSLKFFKDIEPWFGYGALYSGSKEQGIAERKLIEQVLGNCVEQLSFAEENSDVLKESGFIGVPNNKAVYTTYWRKKSPVLPFVAMDPDRDSCGVIWLTAVLPFDGQQIVETIKLIEDSFISYQFEPHITLHCRTGRSINMVVGIMYDRDVDGEDQQVMDCHDEILHMLLKEGYLPYRLGIQSMNSLPPAVDDYGKLLRILKRGLDPNDILAPGRYDFRSDWNI